MQQAVTALRNGRLQALQQLQISAKSRFDDAVWDFDEDGSFADRCRINFNDLLGDRRHGSTMTLEVSARVLMFLLKSEGRSWQTVWQFAQTLRRAQALMLASGTRRWSDLQPHDYVALERALEAFGPEEVERTRLLLTLAQVYALEVPLIDAPRFAIVPVPRAAPCTNSVPSASIRWTQHAVGQRGAKGEAGGAVARIVSDQRVPRGSERNHGRPHEWS